MRNKAKSKQKHDKDEGEPLREVYQSENHRSVTIYLYVTIALFQIFLGKHIVFKYKVNLVLYLVSLGYELQLSTKLTSQNSFFTQISSLEMMTSTLAL